MNDLPLHLRRGRLFTSCDFFKRAGLTLQLQRGADDTDVTPLVGSGSSEFRYEYSELFLNWSRLSEQKFRVDKWNLCRG